MITDPISDMFVRIRNANAKLHEKVDIPSSKVKTEIAKVLKEEGTIDAHRGMYVSDHFPVVVQFKQLNPYQNQYSD